MLERLAAQFLNKYIGEYVENFNPQNLSIGIVQGAVELEGLYIRKDALKDLDLPGIEVKWGYIGNITLRIPSYRNYSEPWVIDMNKLYLIVGPSDLNNSTYNEELEQMNKKEKKAKKLAELEEKWQASQATSKSFYAIWRSYSSSIVTNIVENLQVRLFDLHIRYEDNVTLPTSFAFGMHIDVLCAQTTDETWNPKASSKLKAEKKWKKMDLKEMSFYWDTKSTILEGMPQSELLEAMARSSSGSDSPEKNQTEHFVLCPVSGEARLTRVCSSLPLRSKKTPRLALDVDLPEISLNLTKRQYNQLLTLSGEIARWGTRKQHGSGRPQSGISKNASAWWRWVIDKQIEKVRLRRKQRSIEFALKRAGLIVNYVKSYKAYLNAKYGGKNLDKQIESTLADIRSELSFVELAILHELVYNDIDEETRKKKENDMAKHAEKAKARAKRKELKKTGQSWRWGGWLGKWRGQASVESGSEPTDSSDIDNLATKESPAIITQQAIEQGIPDSVFKDLNDEEIFEMFGDELTDEDTTDTFLKRDSVLLKLNFMLKSGKLTLLQADQNVGLVSLEFKDVEIKSEWRPRYGTHEIKLELGSINLKDLNPLNTHFCDLVKPSTRKQRPSSPPTVSPPEVKSPKKANDSWADFFSFHSSKGNDATNLEEPEKRVEAPVLSITYEKLSMMRSHQFSDRLIVVTAPLCLTVLPGLTDRLKKFFKVPSGILRNADKGMKSQVLTDTAQEKYDLWMRQARAEVTNTVKRLMEGKATAKVSKENWAVSLDIFAPDIIIPEDWTNSNCNVVVLSLGHMTFANHTGDAALEQYLDRANPQQDEFESDDEDYLTPPNTPPLHETVEKPVLSEPDVLENLEAPGVSTKSHFIDQEFLTERMLWDKMYERYHVRFADLQVLVASNKAKWDAYRFGVKTPLHLIDRFSVELTAERRVVLTTDPTYPALTLTGNLPHLTVHLSHKKVHTVMKCIDQLYRKPRPSVIPSNPLNCDTPLKPPALAKLLPRPEKTIDLAKANSKKLVCDFSINQVSVVLEEQRANQIISILEINQIQTKFVEKPYDSTVSFSIYSLLLVDVMQQLGHDYELLLASHRSVYMDVDSGNILDSGTVSPVENSKSSTNLQSPNHVKRCSSDSSKVGSVPTTNVLSKVAENLRQFTRFPALYAAKSDRSKPAAMNPETFQYLITLEIKILRRDISPKSDMNPPNANLYPYTDIKANFSNLDVVFNAKSWVTILNFLYKLKKPSTGAPKAKMDLNEDGVFSDTLNERSLKAHRSVMHFGINQSDLEEKTGRIYVNIDFKKLNVLLMRHMVKFDTQIGRKLATVTMQGAHVETGFQPQNDLKQNNDVKIDVSGSIASLQMQDLTSTKNLSTSHGYEILSVGMHDLVSVESAEKSSIASHFSDEQIRALSFNFKQMVTKSPKKLRLEAEEASISVSAPIIPFSQPPDDHVTASPASDTLLFNMDAEDSRYYKRTSAFKTQTYVDIRLASTCYIHSPRLVAEILAWIDEVGDFAQAQMTTATRQAYKDMAKSIMDKVTDYSKSLVGKNLEPETTYHDGSFVSTATPQVSSVHFSNAEFHFQLKMESPILAFPKSPGSFELLVANLGRITVQNESTSSKPLDKLYIDVENMNLRNHRQREEELEAKRSPEGVSGPSITKLKRDSLEYALSGKNGNAGSQILHNTFLRLTVERKDFIPSRKSSLDVRHCCTSESLERCTTDTSCIAFMSHVGSIADTRMCVTVQAASALTVTLSKQAYEQVLKTLDNISYGGDIDVVTDVMFTSFYNELRSNPVQQSASAPDLFDIKAKHAKLPKQKLVSSASSSYQSTPKPAKEPTLHKVSELQMSQQSPIFNLQNTPTRKYTPISANISVPCLIFQLSGDLSEGEQGIVKVTLERFTAAYKKENRFGTQIDLSLGSLDIEDLLQSETSPDRHIVVSFQKDGNSSPDPLKTVYLSASCPAFIKPTSEPSCYMSASLPSFHRDQHALKEMPEKRQNRGLFRPYDSIRVKGASHSQPASPHFDSDEKKSDDSSPDKTNQCDSEADPCDSTLVKIMAFLVDGNSAAYSAVYDRVNRNIDVDFNSLDCKVNLQTWVVLLDFFGIGTSPKKQYQLDPKTEELFSANQQLDVRSFYENQPQEMINSKINFAVRSFALTLNKQEYELLKANVARLQSKIQIRDAMLRVSGQLGGLSVSDLSPNGSLYRERFIFTGDKALDFDIKKFDEYDQNLERDFDISVRLRMSSIRYVHTQRFQNETVAYCQHFQQLQEVLGRMRAASVGQSVHPTSRRQARVLLDVETDAPIILIPESSHSHRLLVANLGHITVANEFKYDQSPGTLSYKPSQKSAADQNLIDFTDQDDNCLLDVYHVDLIDMDLFTATYSKNSRKQSSGSPTHDFELVFPSYVVTCNSRPLLKEKVKLELQMERNLEKDVKHNGVPDTALSARLSSVYCAINHEQFWLIRGVLDHNTGEVIPDFPQPTAFLQPSKEQTVLTGKVFTGLSMDFYLTNVSIELLQAHKNQKKSYQSLGRLDFVKSKLSYRAYSDNNKTTNLSCEAFRAHDTRFQEGQTGRSGPPSVFTTILGEMRSTNQSAKVPSLLQFELFQRTGPGFVEFTALLNNMRVYLILDWLADMSKYLVDNPDQERCDALRAKTQQLMNQFDQVQSGNQQRKLDSSGQLLPEEQSKKIKTNFTNTEFVLVEDTSRLDSDGVILRSTAVFDYFPDRKTLADFPSSPLLSCSLQSLEVFSCQLNQENETALSIIDPVTINFEVRPIKQTDLREEEILADATILDKTLLDIQVSELNIRVSYNDVMLFLNIFQSITGKTKLEGKSGSASASPSKSSKSFLEPPVELIEPLVEIGYSRSDAIQALNRNDNNVQRAGAWLVEHAQLEIRRSSMSRVSSVTPKIVPLSMARLKLSADVLRVCLIDDCAEDCDVPLTEMAVRHLAIRQDLSDVMTSSYKELLLGQMGSATFNLSGDYYNRMLSLWEPFLEPWRCNVSWRHARSRIDSTPGSWNFEIEASDRFDVTVTSALMETVKMTSTTWRQDYAAASSMKTVSLARKRLPLVAYILRNLTGSSLKFATQTAAMHEGNDPREARQSQSDVTLWQEVLPGADCSFNFATMHEKQRHKRSKSLKLHQIIVQVGEWKTFQPVTVSKVGVYFRHAFKQISKSSSIYEPSVPVRVVFSVTLEGNAQKVVTVRSALAVRSRVKIPIQLSLQTPNHQVALPTLDPGDTLYVPLSLTPYPIKIRPSITAHGIPCTYHYSSATIQWMLVTEEMNEETQLIECESIEPRQSKFYFAVCTERLPYPSYEEVCSMLSQQEDSHVNSDWEDCLPLLPGHTIVILPPVVISNLLPCDLHYYVKNKNVEGTLKPGVDATPHGVHVSPSDSQHSLIVGCLIDGFQSCRELIVPAVAKNFQMRMLIKDWNNETLILNVRVLWRLGCSVKISVTAGYWIVNKTGLPIVVKQEQSSSLAAGQYDIHEQARSLQPLLFSYANREAPYLCTMRLGKNVQIEDYFSDGVSQLRGTPSFCERFSTDGGSCTRNLKLITNDGTPNREFCIGVSVRRGWGRYLHTHIVSIAPRFLLVNRTQKHRLSFAQRHTISYIADSSGVSCHLTIIPGSSCVFHWPRVDLDTLLCVRLADVPSCYWSGGFFIDRTDAFHIALRLATSQTSMRDALSPHCVFLIVEVTLVDATYCVVVSDADPSEIPPPLRIDNASFAPIIFKQVGSDASYNTEVASETQLAYACDEPCLPQKIRCSVRGDSSHIDINMNVVGEEKQLYYKNYFYIAMGVVPHQTTGSDHLSHMTLVLDVQKNQRLFDISLQPLRSGKRSQLWRMTSDGRIFHEGSSPPENAASSAMNESGHRVTNLVLDIAEMAVNVGRSFVQGIPLTLKSPDERRRSTQMWTFGEDGRLKCRHRGLAVQVDRVMTGQPVVLALFDDKRVCLPTEMCTLQKLIPGSGCLSLKVVRDGPTRVLRIVDIRQKRPRIVSGSDSYGQHAHQADAAPPGDSSKYNLSVCMPQGVGISLISNSPEELLYLTMSGVNVHVSADGSEQVFSLTMQKFQIDNQLLDAYPSVLLSSRFQREQQSSANATTVTKPLVSINAVRQPASSRMYEIYKSFVVDLGKLSISLEEKLILKLLYFMGYNPSSTEKESKLLDETKLDSAISWTTLGQTSYTTVKRFYFDTLQLSAAPVRLSVFTASRLSPELKAVKQTLAVPLIQFERAPVALQDYVKHHLFETLSFVMADLSKHLREQLKNQAAIILGSIDFLGNPIGLLSDVKAGIHAGLGQGNVQNMTKHFTHGLSNTTAKFTGALSDKIGGLAMDEDYEDRRKAIQANARSSAGGHVVAGLQGLMAGVVGGLTSVVTQPVKGAQSDGASGFFKGVLKGVVGTVTKPVTGVLDLASESASAVRHMSVSPDQVASRVRPIRCCHSFQGCLQYYSRSQADGQTFLYALNSNDYSEHFYSIDNLNNILVLITNKKVYFVKNREPDHDNIILIVDYSDLISVSVISSNEERKIATNVDYGTNIFLELTMKSQTHGQGYSYQYKSSVGMRYHTKKPRVACHSLGVAERVCWQIRYAKNLASEQTETMQGDLDEEIAQDRAFELEV